MSLPVPLSLDLTAGQPGGAVDGICVQSGRRSRSANVAFELATATMREAYYIFVSWKSVVVGMPAVTVICLVAATNPGAVAVASQVPAGTVVRLYFPSLPLAVEVNSP